MSPILDLGDWKSGLGLYAIVSVVSVMVCSRDEERRKQLRATIPMEGFSKRRGSVSLPPSFLKTIAHAPGLQEDLKYITKMANRGTAAGAILLNIKFLHDSRYEGSVNKAVYLFKKSNPLHRRAPTSETAIRGAWTTFKSVSHLWAALIS